MISPTQLAKLVEAYQARQTEHARQAASVTELDVQGSSTTDVDKAA